MGAFKSAVITKKGQELLAKVVAGTTKLEFTKIKVSDTKLSGDLASMTGIGTIKQEEKVASVVRKNGSNVTVSASFSNQTLGQGYYVRNLGLYANDPQAGEILYSISVADESTATADYMPPFNGIGVSSLMVDLVTAVSNASSVKVNVDPTAGATVAQIVNLQEQIDDVKSFVGYESSDVSVVDHWLKEVKGVKYYFRYMDDMVIFGSSKEELHKLKRELDEFMAVNLKQVLKHNWQVFPTKVRGVDFVGYRFFGEYTLLRKSTCKTFKRRMLSISSKRENNVSPTYSEWCSFNSYVGWLQHCDSFRLYQKYVEPNVEYMHNYYLKEVKGNAEICKRKNYSGERKAS